MKYLLLIQKSEARYNALPEAERRAMEERYRAYGQRLMEAGILEGGAKLRHTDTATTVRVRGGKRLVTDGPFAETEEQVAGIGIIEVPDLDTAIEWAAAHPDAEWASVEVRPIEPYRLLP